MTFTRRDIIRSLPCAALGAAAASATLSNLFRVAEAAEAKREAAATVDYRALVCVFLYGGNDGANCLVPYSSRDYSDYARERTALALARETLLPIQPVSSDGRDFALHASLAPFQRLFADGRLAIVANVGPLVGPLTRAQYLAGSAAVPMHLFSHSDQTIQWQTSISDRPPRTGWGGRVADRLRPLNASSPVSMAISLSGFDTFQTGIDVLPFQVTPEGSLGLDAYDPAEQDPRSKAIKAILRLDRGRLLENAARDVTVRALATERLVHDALGAVAPFRTVFPDSGLARQLQAVARFVAAREKLGQKRQIFFVSIGGFDTHSNQLGPHAELLGELAEAVKAFHDVTVELNVADSVATFTSSDFGGTYASNGSGSDHGWGSPHFVVGGGVRGRAVYGRVPVLAVSGPDDTDEGRFIPSTSVEQYAATLARWFGVPPDDLDTVFPNLSRFDARDLGFMGSPVIR